MLAARRNSDTSCCSSTMQSETVVMVTAMDISPSFEIEAEWHEKGYQSCAKSTTNYVSRLQMDGCQSASLIPWLLAEHCRIPCWGGDVCDGFTVTEIVRAKVSSGDLLMMPRRFAMRSSIFGVRTKAENTRVWKVGAGLFVIGFVDSASSTVYYLLVPDEGELEITTGTEPDESLTSDQIKKDKRVVKIYYSKEKKKHVMCSARNTKLFINIGRSNRIIAERTEERNATGWEIGRN